MLPADFTIDPGETVNPPIVTLPSSANVVLTIASRDARAHTVLVRSAPPRSVRVPASGRASLRLDGLPDGNYVIDVDNGAATATLQMGNGPIP
ncbi:MAG TPA: hypothetical protein VE992_05995 [Solirubrobacteraceae bacterium]|nr:hypothetical protein [Solirubrobacteraceae bacterium]